MNAQISITGHAPKPDQTSTPKFESSAEMPQPGFTPKTRSGLKPEKGIAVSTPELEPVSELKFQATTAFNLDRTTDQ